MCEKEEHKRNTQKKVARFWLQRRRLKRIFLYFSNFLTFFRFSFNFLQHTTRGVLRRSCSYLVCLAMSAIRFILGLKLEMGIHRPPNPFPKTYAGSTDLCFGLIRVISYHGYGKIYPRTETRNGDPQTSQSVSKDLCRIHRPLLRSYPSYVLPWSMAT